MQIKFEPCQISSPEGVMGSWCEVSHFSPDYFKASSIQNTTALLPPKQRLSSQHLLLQCKCFPEIGQPEGRTLSKNNFPSYFIRHMLLSTPSPPPLLAFHFSNCIARIYSSLFTPMIHDSFFIVLLVKLANVPKGSWLSVVMWQKAWDSHCLIYSRL